MENSTLESHSASLVAQNTKIRMRIEALQHEKQDWQSSADSARLQQLSADHASLRALHDTLSRDYEALLSQHDELKQRHRRQVGMTFEIFFQFIIMVFKITV